MTTSSLKERFARLGPVQEIDRVSSGSPEVVVLTPAGSQIAVITAARALARRGISLLKAKRTVEILLAQGKAILDLPMVEDLPQLASDLASAGIAAKRHILFDETAKDIAEISLPALRARLHMTQEAFALQYGFELKTLRGWEQGRKMDKAVLSYIRIIARAPEAVANIADSP
jgi:putative transcriptional regulator